MTTAPMVQFDLRAAVLAAAEVDGDVTIAEVAEKVLAGMTAEDRDSIVAAAVREMAGRILGEERRTALVAPRSAKQDAIRAQWQRMLASRLHIGDGIWKLLGECTEGDLEVAAGARYRLSAQLKATGDRMHDLAEELRRHRVATVAELPAGSIDLDGLK